MWSDFLWSLKRWFFPCDGWPLHSWKVDETGYRRKCERCCLSQIYRHGNWPPHMHGWHE